MQDLKRWSKDRAYICLIKVLSAIRIFLPTVDKACVIAPAEPGSLGDQALMQGIAELLDEKKISMTETIIAPRKNAYTVNEIRKENFYIENCYKANRLRLIAKIFRYSNFIVIGADTLDGTYDLKKNIQWIILCDEISSIGIPTSIISFSFSNNPHAKICRYISESNPKIVFKSRDPISAERFTKFTGRNAEIVADLAFCVNAKASGNSNINRTLDWINEKKRSNYTVIGINVNQIYLGEKIEIVTENFAFSIDSLLDRLSDLHIVLIPHDFREGQSDEEILLAILKRLENNNNRVHLISGPYDCWDVKFMVKKLDAVVTGRMHLGIAALSQGIPTFGFSYKSKFEGLMSLFELERNLLDYRKILDKEILERFMISSVINRNQYKENIEKNLKTVIKLARDNL